MFSWRLWRAIRDTPAHWRLYRMLMPREPYQKSQNPSRYLIMMLFVAFYFFPYLLPLLLIHYFGLQLTWKIANAVAEQHELGKRDLIAMTPAIGDFGLSLEICRLYWDDATERANVAFLRLGCLILVLVALFMLLSGAVDILTILSLMISLVPLLYLEYIESLVIASLIGILMGFVAERGKARAFSLGGYLVIVVGGYAFLGLLWAVAVAIGSQFPMSLLAVFFFGLCAVGVFYFVREAVIFMLWNTLRWRLNDDVPAFRVMISQKR